MNKPFLYNFLFGLLFLLCVNKVFGQLNNNSGCNERAYLQTDKDIYIASENLLFKCYLFNAKSSKHEIRSKYAYFVIRNEQNNLISRIQIQLENGLSSGSIYLSDTLSTGHYQLVVYTNYMRNFGETSFFTKEILIVNRFDKDLKIQTEANKNLSIPDTKSLSGRDVKGMLTITPDKSNYAKREKIRIGIEAIGIPSESIANLAISVVETVPIFDQVSFSINTDSLDKQETIHKRSNCSYLPEINGVIIQGKVIDKDRQGLTNTSVFLSSPDTLIANLQHTTTDSTGTFRFQLNDCYLNRDLIIRVPDIQNANIELDNKFDLKIPFKPSRQFSDSIKRYLLKSQNIVQIQKAYHSELWQEVPMPGRDQSLLSRAYPPIPNPVYPVNFVSLPDFVEISREILPLLKTRKREHKYVTNMFIESQKDFSALQPLIFLDGVPIDDVNQIIPLGSEKINRIEIIGTKRYVGDLNFFGILSIFSKTKEINNIVWKTPVLTVSLFSNQSFLVPLQPDYSKIDKTKPDFRQLLYWEPNFVLTGKAVRYIEFYASDNSGEFEVNAEGITTSGVPISAKVHIKISSNTK
jgi:hypothetical protein